MPAPANKQIQSKSKSYRFDARLNQEQKLLIQRAADLVGRSMTDFVLHSTEIAAERTIERRATLVLTARETEAFVDAVLNPSSPRARPPPCRSRLSAKDISAVTNALRFEYSVEPLTASHDRLAFHSGVPELDCYFHQ
jgi:uncharacterized protein (DUF1778 family)